MVEHLSATVCRGNTPLCVFPSIRRQNFRKRLIVLSHRGGMQIAPPRLCEKRG
jgi:hypothetical protein